MNRIEKISKKITAGPVFKALPTHVDAIGIQLDVRHVIPDFELPMKIQDLAKRGGDMLRKYALKVAEDLSKVVPIDARPEYVSTDPLVMVTSGMINVSVLMSLTWRDNVSAPLPDFIEVRNALKKLGYWS